MQTKKAHNDTYYEKLKSDPERYGAKREKDKEWKRKNRDKVRAQKRRYYQRNREKMIAYNLNYKRKIREQIREHFGNTCCLCNRSGQKIIAHEKNGVKHSNSCCYIINHLEDFVPLCYRCHRMVHLMMEVFKCNWSQIQNLLLVGD